MGGVGLPDFWLYYLASRFTQIAQWHIPDSKIPWVNFERESILPYQLTGLMWTRNVPNNVIASRNTLVSQSLSLWRSFGNKFGLISRAPPGAMFLGDPKFLPGLHNSNIFKHWIDRNLTFLHKFITNSTFTSFEILQSKYKLPHSEHYNFLQIRQFFQKHYQLTDTPNTTFYEKICLKNPRGRGIISEIYQGMTHSTSEEKLPYMHKWEKECNLHLTSDEWQDCILNLRKCTRSITIRETPYKLITRWYFTPSRLHAIFPSSSPNCYRGCDAPGSFTHIFWECNKISFIWQQLDSFASKISNRQINLTLPNCLLFTTIPGLSVPQMRLIHTICVAIHWMIAVNWKSSSFPPSQLKARLSSINLMEKIFHVIYNSTKFYDNKWKPWFDHSNILFPLMDS